MDRIRKEAKSGSLHAEAGRSMDVGRIVLGAVLGGLAGAMVVLVAARTAWRNSAAKPILLNLDSMLCAGSRRHQQSRETSRKMGGGMTVHAV